MGSDPRRLDGLRQDERFAAVLLERATGGAARAHDIGIRQGAHDLDLVLPGGRTAAVEVTTHAGTQARRSSALLGRERYTWPNPGRWWWTAEVVGSELARVRAAYERTITLCEAHDVTSPSALPAEVLESDPELGWLAHESASRLHGHPAAFEHDGRRPRGITVTSNHAAGQIDADLSLLPRAVSDLLTVAHVARRATKVVAARGVDERHLFIGVGEGGLPDAVYLPLTGPVESLPDADPDVPEGLGTVWLTTAWRGSPLVGWHRGRGWRAYPT
ncbi:hypothetical protein GCM10023168_21140 [Fodinibacter luteus]|uniref:Uncharacterized protein n=1 Tax=Fodinibacter luteus TaxID=552064 RepID=A0ABP8KGU2_9MICO